MRRAAQLAWQAGRQHAAAGHPEAVAAHLPQLQQPSHSSCTPSLRCLSSPAAALSSSTSAERTCMAAMPGCCGSCPDANCGPGDWAYSLSPAALVHSRQLHTGLADGMPTGHTSPLLGSGSSQASYRQLLASAAASGAGCCPQHYRADASRAAQACTSSYASPRHHRAFASRAAQALTKGHAAGPAGGQQVTMRIAVASPNQLAEPYTGTPPKLPFLRSWFTPAGWRDRWARGMAGAKSMYTIRACKKNIEGFALPGFKAEALKTYSAICASLATGNVNALRQLTTSSVFSEMKKELRNREAAGWSRVSWGLVQKPELNEMAVVHGRLIYMNPKDDSSAFAQLTVRLSSTQRFAAYDARGRLVAGDPDGTLPVTDLWVFEISLRKSIANRWRLAARLNPALK